MLGIWKNFDELEESLNLDELQLILKQKREDDKQKRHFFAGIQGIDLSKNESGEVDERLAAVQRRAAARLAGSEEEVEKQELAAIGFKVKQA